jgi:hypothetical protein
MNNLNEQLASLQARCASLEKQVADLQASMPSPAPENRRAETKRPAEPQRVTITRLPDQNPSLVMPTDNKLRRLHKIVLARYPQVVSRSQQGR